MRIFAIVAIGFDRLVWEEIEDADLFGI